MATGDVASIKDTIGKGYFPSVVLKDYALKWYPNADSMFISTTRQIVLIPPGYH